MRSDVSVFLFLTEQCNLTCSHCYVSSGPTRTATMPYGLVKRALDVFGASGVDDFRLTGGEPTLHPQFESILKTIAESGHRARLVSNGKRLYHDVNCKRLLSLLDVCWVSAYGTTPERHASVAGAGALPLPDLERWVGGLAADRFRIGLSVLLRRGDSRHTGELLERLSAAGVRRLRLLPLQPDGRALLAARETWAEWPAELKVIYNVLTSDSRAARFELLTLNDPFDVAERLVRPQESCLLRTRRMWSVVPNGDIYSCCFNVYQPPHRIANVEDPRLIDVLARWAPTVAERACRAFEGSYWREANAKKVSCPISSIPVTRSGSPESF